jgi:hypothetical protein
MHWDDVGAFIIGSRAITWTVIGNGSDGEKGQLLGRAVCESGDDKIPDNDTGRTWSSPGTASEGGRKAS